MGEPREVAERLLCEPFPPMLSHPHDMPLKEPCFYGGFDGYHCLVADFTVVGCNVFHCIVEGCDGLAAIYINRATGLMEYTVSFNKFPTLQKIMDHRRIVSIDESLRAAHQGLDCRGRPGVRPTYSVRIYPH